MHGMDHLPSERRVGAKKDLIGPKTVAFRGENQVRTGFT